MVRSSSKKYTRGKTQEIPTCITIKGSCSEGEILRLGYTRKSYAREQNEEGPIKLKKDISLRKYGYSTTHTLADRRTSLDRAVKDNGPGPIVVRLNKLAVLQSRNPTAYKKFLEDLKYVQVKYKYNKLY